MTKKYECGNCGKEFKTFAAAKKHQQESYPEAWNK
jgi:DNA-directed RNA polymerase subunit RPC12/RpoP